MKKSLMLVISLVVGLSLAACGNSGPSEEEKQAAEEAQEKAVKLEREAKSAATVARTCRQQLSPLVTALRDTGSRLSVGIVFADYSDQVGQISIAYDQIPFNKMDVECIAVAGVKAEKAFNAYSDAHNQWNDCIGDLYCDMDSIDSDLQSAWQRGRRLTGESRNALAVLQSLATEAEEKAEKQEEKAEEAEAVLET